MVFQKLMDALSQPIQIPESKIEDFKQQKRIF